VHRASFGLDRLFWAAFSATASPNAQTVNKGEASDARTGRTTVPSAVSVSPIFARPHDVENLGFGGELAAFHLPGMLIHSTHWSMPRSWHRCQYHQPKPLFTLFQKPSRILRRFSLRRRRKTGCGRNHLFSATLGLRLSAPEASLAHQTLPMVRVAVRSGVGRGEGTGSGGATAGSHLCC
jgi:hypothetical protein